MGRERRAPFALLGAESPERDEVPVVEPPEQLHLAREVVLRLVRAFVHALHRRHQAVFESGLVDSAESAPPDDGAEVVRRLLHLAQLESPEQRR